MRCFALIIAFLLLLPPPLVGASEDEGRAEGAERQSVHIVPFPKPEDCDTARCRAYWAAIKGLECRSAERLALENSELAYSAAEFNYEAIPTDPEIDRLIGARLKWMFREGAVSHPEILYCTGLQQYRLGQEEMDETGDRARWGPRDERLFRYVPDHALRWVSSGQITRDSGIMWLIDLANCRNYGPASLALAGIFEDGKAFPKNPEMTYFLLLNADMTGARDQDRLDRYEARLGGHVVRRVRERVKNWRASEGRKFLCGKRLGSSEFSVPSAIEFGHALARLVN